MKKLLMTAFAAFGIFAATAPAYAIFGVGDIVLDPSNLVQNTSTAIHAVKTEINTAQSYIVHLKQLESLALSLKSVNGLSSLAGVQQELALYNQLKNVSTQMLGLLDRSQQLSSSVMAQVGASNMDWKTFLTTRSDINKTRAQALASQYASMNQSITDVAQRRQAVVDQLQQATGETSAMQGVGAGIDVLIGQNQQMIAALRLQGMAQQNKEDTESGTLQQGMKVISDYQKALLDADAKLK